MWIAATTCRWKDGYLPPAIRVLFVEDDEATRVGYAQYLTAKGYDVLSVSNGSDALTAALTSEINIVILDLGLPDIDGWEVARTLRASPAMTHVPIIALSGSDLPHERVSALRAGCDRHLAKPCSPDHLVDAIQRTLSLER
jgi:two-component system, cell cycle response regulator DivK